MIEPAAHEEMIGDGSTVEFVLADAPEPASIVASVDDELEPVRLIWPDAILFAAAPPTRSRIVIDYTPARTP